jgi:uncharacterized protein
VFRVGEPALIRFFKRERLWDVSAVTVVADTESLVALYLAAGMPRKVPCRRDGTFSRELCLNDEEYELVDGVWTTTDTLWLIRPGAAHATTLFWTQGQGELLCWYINLQAPFRRTRLGFDTSDHLLDVVVAPDLSGWTWKDEDEFEQAQACRFLSTDEARRIRAEGERVIETVLRRQSPFRDGWERWRPDPTWPAPTIPTGWDAN